MNRSDSIKNIAESMVKVQEEIKGMVPDAKNPFFKSNYITLDGILEYIRPILTKNQIWVTQEAKGCEQYVSVRTTLVHVSGEYIETDSLEMVPVKNDPQVVGSLITYMKRYQLAALMGISSEVDDDGNKASEKKASSNKKEEATIPADLKSHSGITEGQIKRLFAIVTTAGQKMPQVKAAILKKYNITELEQLTKEQYDHICKSYEGAKK